MRRLALTSTLALTWLVASAQDATTQTSQSLHVPGADKRLFERALKRVLSVPVGLPAVQHPPDNPPSAMTISLGRKLFFDRRLSLNETMSCAMCHVPEQAFANNELAIAVGLNGNATRRNAPTLINVAYYKRLFTDGRGFALETQFYSPLLSVNEMANPSVGAVVNKIAGLADYDGLFEQAFAAPVSPDLIGKALAVYQRTLIGADSPFDRWRRRAAPEQRVAKFAGPEQRGLVLFTGKAGCAGCHHIQQTVATFTDQRFHDTGYGWEREQLRQHPPATQRVQVAPGVYFDLPMAQVNEVADSLRPDLGRYEATLEPADLWSYRTPGLRNVAVTGPYMHDGGLSSLMQVVQFYDRGGPGHQQQSPQIRPLGLTAREKSDLVAFLESLTSPHLARLIAEARVSPPDNRRGQ